jgi:hypothetical protein
MGAIAGNFNFFAGVFAVLAAVFFVILYDTTARRVGAFLGFAGSHDFSP